MKLYDWQLPHADKLEQVLRSGGVAIDGSDTGVGKMVIGSEIARRGGGAVFVVCPKAIVTQWKRTLAEFGVTPVGVVNYEKLKMGNTPFGKWNRQSWEWTLPAGTLIIWDEARRCKATNSKNAKMLRDSLGHPLMLLSATLAESPMDLRAVLHVTGLSKWSGFFGYLLRNGCRKARFGGFEMIPHKKEEILHALHEELFQKRGSRIRIADLGDKFPETQISAEAIDLGDPEAIQKIYDEMEEELDNLSDAASNDKGENPLTIQLRARQKTELLKVPGVAALAQNFIEEGNSVVIFTNFKASLEALCDKLGTKDAIYGGQSAPERQGAIDRFQRDEARVLIVNIQAGGEGISLHDINGRFPRVALLFPTFSASDLRQALGRVRRSGGKSKSIQRILFAAGTVEEAVCKRVQDKLADIDRLNDGDLNFSEKRMNAAEDPVSTLPTGLSNQHMTSQPEQATEPLRDIKEISLSSPTPLQASAPGGVATLPDGTSSAGVGLLAPIHAARAHSRHSPSSLLNKAKCCGWENDNSPDRDTTAADRGTCGHTMIETRNFDLAPDDDFLTRAARRCAEFLDGMRVLSSSFLRV